MTKVTLYTYLGTNGTIISPVHLEDIYYIRKYQLRADEGKKLTRDGKFFYNTVTVSEEDIENWSEVKA